MLPAQRPCTCSNRPSVEPRVKLAPLLRLCLLPLCFPPPSIHRPLPPLHRQPANAPVLCLQARISSTSLTSVLPGLLIPASSCHCARRPSGFLRHQPRIMSDGIAPAVDKGIAAILLRATLQLMFIRAIENTTCSSLDRAPRNPVASQSVDKSILLTWTPIK